MIEIPRPTSEERTTGSQEGTDRAKRTKRLARLRREYEQAEELAGQRLGRKPGC